MTGNIPSIPKAMSFKGDQPEGERVDGHTVHCLSSIITVYSEIWKQHCSSSEMGATRGKAVDWSRGRTDWHSYEGSERCQPI